MMSSPPLLYKRIEKEILQIRKRIAMGTIDKHAVIISRMTVMEQRLLGRSENPAHMVGIEKRRISAVIHTGASLIGIIQAKNCVVRGQVGKQDRGSTTTGFSCKRNVRWQPAFYCFKYIMSQAACSSRWLSSASNCLEIVVIKKHPVNEARYYIRKL